MPKIQQSQHNPYPPEQLYQLVNDIERYPEFLPGCSDAKILSADKDRICAELFIRKGPLQLCFSTKNQLIENKRIDMTLLTGPFKYFNGIWSFEPTDNGSLVSLEMDFALSNGLLQMTLGPLFQKLAQDMVNVFLKRAKKIYGVADASH
jgi:ribosome-associated toxin RatA of RatAB toxin-antitoxin module